MQRRILGLLICAILLSVGGLLLINCATAGPPTTFVQSQESRWRTIEIAEQYSYDQAWEKLVDALARRWDLEIMDKQSGYLRTGWTYTIGGVTRSSYRGRIHVKFSEDRRRLDMKTDALWLGQAGDWVPGYDALLLEDAYSEILGKLGRTSR